LGDKQGHLVIVLLTVSKLVTMLSLDFSVVPLAEQEMGGVDMQMVMICHIRKTPILLFVLFCTFLTFFK